MTVLNRRDARGFDSGPIRKYLVGLAVAVAGVAAAFGLSQIIDQDAAAVETGLTAVERNAIAQSQAESAASAERLDQALIERFAPPVAPEFTLQDELAALHAARTNTQSPAAIEQARGQAMVEHYTNQWETAASTSQSGPR